MIILLLIIFIPIILFLLFKKSIILIVEKIFDGNLNFDWVVRIGNIGAVICVGLILSHTEVVYPILWLILIVGFVLWLM